MTQTPPIVLTVNISKRLPLTLVGLALLMAVLTYLEITGRESALNVDTTHINLLLSINLVVLGIMGGMVGLRLLQLWRRMKHGATGSRLQSRVVGLFSLMALIPALLVSVFSAIFFNFGLKAWFDEKVTVALRDSLAVAEAYLGEHKEIIRADAMAMAGDISREMRLGEPSSGRLNAVITAQAGLRSVNEAVLIQHNRIVAMSELSFSVMFEQLPTGAMERAADGEVVTVTTEKDDRVRALVKVPDLADTYLLIGRFVDSNVLNYMESTQGAVSSYLALKSEIKTLQIKVFTVFVVLVLVLMLASVWYGMHFAGRMVGPLVGLIRAAERVRVGDFSVTVPEGRGQDELALLARAFNRMTSQLEQQRQELIEANRLLDGRRRFIEAVLGGVSAGVIAVDHDQNISLANASACQITGYERATLEGIAIRTLFPELAPVLKDIAKHPDKVVQRDLAYTHQGKAHTLHMRIAADSGEKSRAGFILTFDDITDLLVAQRTAAWADVARRVAHEIKNPLTPIQLSTERLRKKFAPVAEAEQEQFYKYVDTIARHVGDIGKIVEEFVSFARMPAPALKPEALAPIIRQCVFSEQVGRPGSAIDLSLPDEPLTVTCDSQMIGRVLTNLLKNASEALEDSEDGHIWVTLERVKDEARVTIRDNGKGFNTDVLARAAEPYVTTKQKGTGLGLAIVKKIIEEHGGLLTIANHPDGGAQISFTLPLA